MIIDADNSTDKLRCGKPCRFFYAQFKKVKVKRVEEVRALTKNELLKYAIDNDMIDLSQIESQVDMSKRKARLKHIAPFSENVFSVNDKRIAAETIRRYLKKACETAGVPYKSDRIRVISPVDFITEEGQ